MKTKLKQRNTAIGAFQQHRKQGQSRCSFGSLEATWSPFSQSMCACTGVVVKVFSSLLFTVGQAAAIFTAALVVCEQWEESYSWINWPFKCNEQWNEKNRYRQKTLDHNTVTRFTINLIDFAFAYSSASNSLSIDFNPFYREMSITFSLLLLLLYRYELNKTRGKGGERKL